jgi:hypothetical protein
MTIGIFGLQGFSSSFAAPGPTSSIFIADSSFNITYNIYEAWVKRL